MEATKAAAAPVDRAHRKRRRSLGSRFKRALPDNWKVVVLYVGVIIVAVVGVLLIIKSA